MTSSPDKDDLASRDLKLADGGVREPDYDAEMRLPEGVACDDCAHAARCFGFGFSTPGRTSCDFWPRRFRAATASPAGADLGPGRTTK